MEITDFKAGMKIRIKTLEELKKDPTTSWYDNNNNMPTGWGKNGKNIVNRFGSVHIVTKTTGGSVLTTQGEYFKVKDIAEILEDNSVEIPELKRRPKVFRKDGELEYYYEDEKGTHGYTAGQHVNHPVSTTTSTIYGTDTLGTYDKEGTYPVPPVAKEEVLDVPVLWKNPTPTKINQMRIQQGGKVLKDGEALLLKVISVNTEDKTCVIKTIEGKKRVPWSVVYPVYPQKEGTIKVGNIVELDNGSIEIVKKLSADSIITSNNNTINRKRITKTYGKSKQVKEYEEYSCGTVVVDKKTMTKDDLRRAYPAFNFKGTKVDNLYADVEIASYYKIEVKDLRPKEISIHKTLDTTLEHPLNVAKKRWALLLGESGTGKTEAALDYAKRVGRKYVKLQGTSQLTVDDLIGYKSITTGVYITSLLRLAVEFGYIFILDEIDACNQNTLMVLNGLKQSTYQFPDALVDVHENFRLIGTANTLEYSEEYNARQPMDKATRARFKIIEYNMKPYELAIRYGFKHIKSIENITRLTPREVEGIVIDKQIEEMEA